MAIEGLNPIEFGAFAPRKGGPMDPTLSELVDIQREFDLVNFTGASCAEDKRRHIVFHLAKLLGKAASAEERRDHGVTDFRIIAEEVVPDLLVYAAQLSDVLGIDLAESYRARLLDVARRNGTRA